MTFQRPCREVQEFCDGLEMKEHTYIHTQRLKQGRERKMRGGRIDLKIKFIVIMFPILHDSGKEQTNLVSAFLSGKQKQSIEVMKPLGQEGRQSYDGEELTFLEVYPTCSSRSSLSNSLDLWNQQLRSSHCCIHWRYLQFMDQDMCSMHFTCIKSNNAHNNSVIGITIISILDGEMGTLFYREQHHNTPRKGNNSHLSPSPPRSQNPAGSQTNW